MNRRAGAEPVASKRVRDELTVRWRVWAYPLPYGLAMRELVYALMRQS